MSVGTDAGATVCVMKFAHPGQMMSTVSSAVLQVVSAKVYLYLSEGSVVCGFLDGVLAEANVDIFFAVVVRGAGACSPFLRGRFGRGYPLMIRVMRISAFHCSGVSGLRAACVGHGESNDFFDIKSGREIKKSIRRVPCGC